jgi:hypothetical protein
MQQNEVHALAMISSLVLFLLCAPLYCFFMPTFRLDSM